jgi:hypothetical protein
MGKEKRLRGRPRKRMGEKFRIRKRRKEREGNGPRKGIKNRLNKEPGNRVEGAKGDKTKKKGLSY